MSPLIGYYRVSTQKQGRSGLGLEAQRKAVAAFAKGEGFEIIAEFTEVETGKGANALDRRPQLKAALKAAKKAKCEFAVAKLDRLSRRPVHCRSDGAAGSDAPCPHPLRRMSSFQPRATGYAGAAV